MNIGAPELLILVVVVGFLYCTIAGAIRAGQNGDGGWLAGILLGWFVGLGWLIGLIYLMTHPRTAR